MLKICIEYFAHHGIKISVDAIVEKSKTKCMAFNVSVVPTMLTLYNLVLPWVDSALHLGHLITTEEDTSADILIRKGEFNSKVHELRQELGDQYPFVFIQLVRTYLTSMYGSNLWDLYHASAEKLYIAWNFLIKNTFKLPYATHRYILYNITEIPHLRVALLRRFVKFYNKLQMCNKPEILHLFYLQRSDQRSVFGRNCRKLCAECGVVSVDYVNVKSVCMPIEMGVSDEWRMPFLLDLLDLRDYNSINSDISKEHIDSMISLICCE